MTDPLYPRHASGEMPGPVPPDPDAAPAKQLAGAEPSYPDQDHVALCHDEDCEACFGNLGRGVKVTGLMVIDTAVVRSRCGSCQHQVRAVWVRYYARDPWRTRLLTGRVKLTLRHGEPGACSGLDLGQPEVESSSPCEGTQRSRLDA